MNKLKKIGLFAILLASVLLVAGCGNKNVEGALEDLMTKVYENVPEDEKPMMLMNVEVNEENVEYYLGSADIEFEEALASESATGSIAHSVVLLRAKDGADIEAIKTTIKENINPRKWICVEAEDVVVKNKGNLIILIMTSTGLDALEKGFNNL